MGEPEFPSADLKTRPVQQAGPGNARTLMQGAVAGAKIPQPPFPLDQLDDRMMAGDGGLVDDDQIIHFPPDGHHLLTELIFGAGLIGVSDFEPRHEERSGGAGMPPWQASCQTRLNSLKSRLMSSPPATAQDGIPRPAETPLRHPLALMALGLAFLAATLGAFGLSSRLTSSSAAENTGIHLAAGSLALLHARLEQQSLMASLMSSGNEELTRLDAEVKALEKKLTEVTSQVKKEEASLASLMEQTTNSESRRQALLAEKPRLDRIAMAFDAALAKKKEADSAIKTALGSTGMTLTTADLTAWQAEWERESKEALDKIKEARDSLADLRIKEDQWIKGKDTFTPDQQKERQKDLRSLHAETTSKLKAARETAAAAEQKLIPLITNQRQQLEKAEAAPPP